VERSAEADFEGFVARSGRSLLRTAWLLTGDRGHAEDIVQTALERTARRWARLSGDPESYARRAVVNLATDRWRRRRARPIEVALSDLPAAVSANPADDIATADLRDLLLSDLRRLPSRQRAVLVLRYFDDLDVAQTADLLGVSISTVKSSASRGLAQLRLQVNDHARDEHAAVRAEGDTR
jgi:RNA polymerase sigma-70 factor (sigma-E family)